MNPNIKRAEFKKTYLADWVQTFAIIGSMLAVWYAFYNITDKRIDKIEERMEKMDAKWERLFERLLIQDQQKKSN